MLLIVLAKLDRSEIKLRLSCNFVEEEMFAVRFLISIRGINHNILLQSITI